MKRAVIYARVSTTRQADEGVSMDAQIEQCTRRAEQLGATVTRVFRDDGVSGRSMRGRTGFQAALEYCLAGGVDFFIVWSTSRFARNAIDLWMQQDALKEAGTRLEALNADIDDESDSGFINKMFFATMDQLQSRQIARDTLRSMKRSAADGFFTGGRVPFGYQAVPDGDRTRLEVHPENGAIVRRIFELALQGMGAQIIAQRLNAACLLRAGDAWGKNSVHYILKNTVYTGVKTFNRTNGKTGREKPRAEWVVVDSHPPLISKQDFERAQTMMDERTPHEHGGTPRAEWVFAGLLRCGICGDGLQITTGKGRAGTLYSYYGCVGHKKKGRAQCLFRPVRADRLDEWLTGEILDKVLTPEVVTKAIDDVVSQSTAWLQDRETRRAQLVKEMRDLEARREKLFDVLELGGKCAPGMDDLAERLKMRNAQIDELQQALAELESSTVPNVAQMKRIEPSTAIEVMREVVASGEAKKKRAFMGAFLEAVTVTAEAVTIDYRAEALLQADPERGVRSVKHWLPVGGSQRTAARRLVVTMPNLASRPWRACWGEHAGAGR